MTRLPVGLIRVAEAGRITPGMARITFEGAHLTGREPDRQVKLYFPKPGQDLPRLPDADGGFAGWYQAFTAIPEPERPWTRSYTVRAHDPGTSTVTVDFVLHGDSGEGPATRWARSARPGDTLGMFGPSDMFARTVPLSASLAEADWVLMAGDETTLPAIGTMIESLPDGVRVLAYVEVADAAEEQRFDTRGEVTLRWLHRDGIPAGHSDLLTNAVTEAEFPAGSVFAWLGGEAGTVRALRRYLVGDRKIDKTAIDFTGYWRAGLTQDDPPTGEDLADANELLAAARDAV
ncbi:siderophore-interacting protein [Amycolatopsis pigmentata]|uniref:Siderophore-interacting protein n=1 Tax=Amycolatopsis pigmentata TaxID=450801 RepID=A0ABW5FM62_9PSEU